MYGVMFTAAHKWSPHWEPRENHRWAFIGPKGEEEVDSITEWCRACPEEAQRVYARAVAELADQAPQKLS